MNKFILATGIAMLLGGCGTIAGQFRAAEEPAAGERARVRVIAPIAASAAPGSACMNRGLPGAGMVLGRNLTASAYRGRTLGMPGGADASTGDSAEFYVLANQPISFVQEDHGAAQRCPLKPVTFVPEAGKDYEVRYLYGRGSCNVEVRSLTDKRVLPNTNGRFC